MALFFAKPSTTIDDDLIEDQSSAASIDSAEEDSWVLDGKQEMGEERGGEEGKVVEGVKVEIVPQVSFLSFCRISSGS